MPDRNVQVRFCLRWFWNSENGEFLTSFDKMFTVMCTLYWIRFSSSSVSPWFCSISVWCLLIFFLNSEPIWFNESIIVEKYSCYSCKACTILQVFSTLWQVIYVSFIFYLHSCKCAAKNTSWFRILLLLQMRIFW